MGTTARGYEYPSIVDEPNVPAHLQALAEDVDADVQALADAIEELGGDPGGGGGGGDAVGGTFVATGSGQLIPNTTSGPGTVCAFGDQLDEPTGITRTAEGQGHKFELLSSGLWAAGATIRVQSAAAAGEFSANVRYGTSAFDKVLAADGGRREGLPRTLNPSSPARYLPAGTKLLVHLFNGTGSQRTLEPNSGAWVQLDIWRVG